MGCKGSKAAKAATLEKQKPASTTLLLVPVVEGRVVKPEVSTAERSPTEKQTEDSMVATEDSMVATWFQQRRQALAAAEASPMMAEAESTTADSALKPAESAATPGAEQAVPAVETLTRTTKSEGDIMESAAPLVKGTLAETEAEDTTAATSVLQQNTSAEEGHSTAAQALVLQSPSLEKAPVCAVVEVAAPTDAESVLEEVVPKVVSKGEPLYLVNTDGSPVADGLRPIPLSDEPLDCVSEAGSDDTVPIEPVRPAGTAKSEPIGAERVQLPQPEEAERCAFSPQAKNETEDMARMCTPSEDTKPHSCEEHEPHSPLPTPKPISSASDAPFDELPAAGAVPAGAPCEETPEATFDRILLKEWSQDERKGARVSARSPKSAGADVAKQAYQWWQNSVATPLTQFSHHMATGYDNLIETIQEGYEDDADEDDEDEDAEIKKEASQTAEDAFPPPPCAPLRPLPATQESYKWLVDVVALPAMRFSKDLAMAYQRFKEANDLHILVHKRQSPEALYHMAACLSLAADRCIASNGVDVVPNLPPAGNHAPMQLAEMRLELALATLAQAIDAGYADASGMLINPDINAVRERRQVQVAGLTKHAVANSALHVGTPHAMKTDNWLSAQSPLASQTPSQRVSTFDSRSLSAQNPVAPQQQFQRVNSFDSRSGLALRQLSIGSGPLWTASGSMAPLAISSNFVGIQASPSRVVA